MKVVSPLTTRIWVVFSIPARRPWCSNSHCVRPLPGGGGGWLRFPVVIHPGNMAWLHSQNCEGGLPCLLYFNSFYSCRLYSLQSNHFPFDIKHVMTDSEWNGELCFFHWFALSPGVRPVEPLRVRGRNKRFPLGNLVLTTGWKCKLATVKCKKADVSSVSPSSFALKKG